jgi:hypothetical protein
MKLMTRGRASTLATLAAGAAIGFFAIGTTAASAAAPAAATVTQHYSLAASAYTPDGLHTTTEDYFNEWDPTTLSNTDNGRCFNAGLSLPPKANLKSITVYYTAGADVMFFEINEQTLATHTGTELVNFDTAANTGTPDYTSMTETFPANTVVNMAQNAYSSGVCPNGSTTFSGFTITYTVPA